MKSKVFSGLAAALGLMVAFSLSVGISSARQPAGYAQDKEKDKDKKEKVNKAEEAAYKKVTDAQTGDPASQIPVAEDFVVKFPASRYLPGVYGMLTSAYFSTQNYDKMFETGAKALAANPDNPDVLALLAMAIPRRIKATSPEGQQQLAKAEQYARHAIELIPNLTKPDTVDEATFEKAKNEKLSLAYSGLGLIDMNRQKYDDAKTELEQAVKLASNPDPVDYFLLGNADVQGSYYHAAIAAYEQCAGTGPLTTQCKSREDSAKKDLASGTKLSRD